MIILVESLIQALRTVPGGVEWLQLVLEGEGARAAAKRLGRGGSWLRRVREVCAGVVYAD